MDKLLYVLFCSQIWLQCRLQLKKMQTTCTKYSFNSIISGGRWYFGGAIFYSTRAEISYHFSALNTPFSLSFGLFIIAELYFQSGYQNGFIDFDII